MANLDELINSFWDIRQMADVIAKEEPVLTRYEAYKIAIGLYGNTIKANSLFEGGDSNLKAIADYLSDIHTRLEQLVVEELPETHKALQNVASSFLER